MTYEQNQYLIHYGVKGQKRGIRRFQNEDGSLTAEGKEHYGVGDGREQKAKIPTKNTAQSGRKNAEAIKNLVAKKKTGSANANPDKDKKKQMREHRAKWMASMMGVGASMLSQKLVSSAAKNNPKLKSFYKGMTAVNVASVIANGASAYREGRAYQKIKHPERYKKS